MSTLSIPCIDSRDCFTSPVCLPLASRATFALSTFGPTCAIAIARRLLDRFFHRLDHDRLVDHLLGGDRVRNSDELGTVGGNRTGHARTL